MIRKLILALGATVTIGAAALTPTAASAYTTRFRLFLASPISLPFRIGTLNIRRVTISTKQNKFTCSKHCKIHKIANDLSSIN